MCCGKLLNIIKFYFLVKNTDLQNLLQTLCILWNMSRKRATSTMMSYFRSGTISTRLFYMLLLLLLQWGLHDGNTNTLFKFIVYFPCCVLCILIQQCMNADNGNGLNIIYQFFILLLCSITIFYIFIWTVIVWSEQHFYMVNFFAVSAFHLICHGKGPSLS